MYSLNTVYFFCATIGVFALVNFTFKYAPVQVKRTAIWRKTTAGLRYLAYRGFQLPALRYWSPSLGILLLGIVGTVFFFGSFLWTQYIRVSPNMDSYDFGSEALLLA